MSASQSQPIRFEEVFTTYQDKVYRLALGMSGNAEDAAEISQEIFLRIFRGLAEFRGECAVSTWVYGVARNTAISCLRKRKVRAMPTINESGELLAETTDAASGSPENRERNQALLNCVSRLPDEQQQATILFYFEGHSIREMHEILGWTESKIKVALYRARKTLAGMLPRAVVAE